ncbi:uncharacterized protein LOC114912200 [Scleropages formosus]|uniref:uncharacterized protein LOC114912200 n=1 Tax=Scleropages formosus TaxID=113540 RepID=UPI0010FA8212|nr:uncharacterized protein LOC114912200 [Scleropages formosus]
MTSHAFDGILPGGLQKVRAILMTSALLAVCVLINFLLKADYHCICSDFSVRGTAFFIVYILLPALSLFLLVLVTNKSCMAPSRLLCCCCPSRRSKEILCLCCRNRCTPVTKGLFAACVWIISVLFDGDWYVCLRTSRNIAEVRLPCESKESRTAEENSMITQYYNESMTWSFGVMFCCVFVWTLSTCCYKCFTDSYEQKYNKYKEKETKKALKNYLERLAMIEAETMCNLTMPSIEDISSEQPRTSADSQSTSSASEQVTAAASSSTSRERLMTKAEKIEEIQEEMSQLYGAISMSDFYLYGLQEARAENSSTTRGSIPITVRRWFRR